LTSSELNTRLEAGDRRQGYVLYRPACPRCTACQAIRIDVEKFNFSRSMRRIEKRAHRELRIETNAPSVDERRVELYNEHKLNRALGDGQAPITQEGYRDFLVATCCDTFELSFYEGDQLVAVSVVDRADNALSAVYCCYNKGAEKYSVGTLNILHQLRLCQEWGLKYLYLGLYIGDCEAMKYKSRFYPQDRLIQGEWLRFNEPESSL
jgi:arginine-tRNA-protein transferase